MQRRHPGPFGRPGDHHRRAVREAQTCQRMRAVLDKYTVGIRPLRKSPPAVRLNDIYAVYLAGRDERPIIIAGGEGLPDRLGIALGGVVQRAAGV